MITQGMKCNTFSCGKMSTHIVFWPGKIPPPRYCLSCALSVEELLKLSGIDEVVVRKLTDKEKDL